MPYRPPLGGGVLQDVTDSERGKQLIEGLSSHLRKISKYHNCSLERAKYVWERKVMVVARDSPPKIRGGVQFFGSPLKLTWGGSKN